MPRFTIFSTALLAISLLDPSAASAQSQHSSAPGVVVTDGGNRVIYTIEYFNQYSVVTAEDQISRIPGIQDLLDGGSDDRGFGSDGDQILINGSRISGKSNDVGSVLERIQARQVLQIEVIRGSVPGLDVRSKGRVVNVVLKESPDSGGYGSFSAGLQNYSGGELGGYSTLSYSNNFGAMDYLLSLEGQLDRDIETADDRFFTEEGTLIERADETANEKSRSYVLSANTSYEFTSGNRLNLNAQFIREDESGSERSSEYLVTGNTETADGQLLDRENEPEDSWEIGGDYRYSLANGNTLTTVFIYSRNSSSEDGSFYHIPVGGTAILEELQIEESRNTEKIVRSAYEWNLGENHVFESGGEMAINTSEQDARLFESEDGDLVEVTLFNQASDIRETRYEAFTNYSWQATEQLLMESSLELEYSEIEQQGGDVNRIRDFIYPKPRMVLSYAPNEQTQIRSRIERTVGQLDFGDFVASFVNDDNRSDVISAGNPEIEPEKAWEYELTYERQLPNDLGIFSITALYADISDHLATIPLLVETGQGSEISTAPGNLEDAYDAGIEFNSSLRLDWLSIPGAVLDLSLDIGRSRVTDPFTGERRSLNERGKYNWTLAYRQDLDWKGFSYGFEARKQAAMPEYDLDYWQEEDEGQALDVFAELQPAPNLTLRFEAENLLDAQEQRVRYQYAGSRSDSTLERLERRNSFSGREFSLSVQWVF